MSGRETVELLKEARSLRPGGIIHICGKTSTSLEYMGMCTSKTYELSGRRSFAQALLDIHDPGRVQITGHNCILVTAAPIEHQCVSFLQF